MPQSHPAMGSERFRFGLFEFDATKLELRREGLLLRLQPQPAQALACLVKKAGEVVSREELRDAVWGAETFVDFERGLNFCIAQMRSALGDDSTTPRFIRTIPRRGYQFIAPVEAVLPEPGAEVAGAVSVPSRPLWQRSASPVAIVVLILLAFGAGYRLRSAHAVSGARRPVVAVVRFDNETADRELSGFSDGLTDAVVEQLTTTGSERYAVVGNAAVLRVPREGRDLSAIAASLHANYVILGQVQSNEGQMRILAHLIRMPEQTHLWVIRVDNAKEDSLTLESSLAQKIAAEFSWRIAKDASGERLPPFPSH